MARRKHSGISDQRKASIHRLRDAQALFEKGRWRGAMYLAGYAVECRLKHVLMRTWRCFQLKELEDKLQARDIQQTPFTHSLHSLMVLAGGVARIQSDPILWRQFSLIVNAWQPAWRYEPNLGSLEEAAAFLEAIRRMVAWIENNL
jgi:HEPN domain-containing protein